MSKNHLLSLVILLFLKIACSKDNGYVEFLTGVNSKTGVIHKLNYNQGQEDLLLEIDSLFEEDLCWNEKTIGLQIDDTNIKTIIYKTCTHQTKRNRPHSKLSIFLNEAGEEVLIDTSSKTLIIRIEELSNKVESLFPNTNDDGHDEIIIHWEQKTPSKSIEEVLKQAREGYLKIYQNLAHKNYDKSLSKLSDKQLYELKKKFPFRVKLGFGTLVILPKRPPSEKNDNK